MYQTKYCELSKVYIELITGNTRINLCRGRGHRLYFYVVHACVVPLLFFFFLYQPSKYTPRHQTKCRDRSHSVSRQKNLYIKQLLKISDHKVQNHDCVEISASIIKREFILQKQLYNYSFSHFFRVLIRRTDLFRIIVSTIFAWLHQKYCKLHYACKTKTQQLLFFNYFLRRCMY